MARQQIPATNTGAVLALHTAGDLLHWHPHVHMLGLNGSLLDDGHFLKLSNVDAAALENRFADKVFDALLDEQLITQETVDARHAVLARASELCHGGLTCR